ncbi:MAG: SDR family NAD(P)-dependent oxidoreductase, partial [Aestuariivirga sp.]|nr:SDR family NAD(P)-dependent oxidoreductase [Aestuariivirga sp.]
MYLEKLKLDGQVAVVTGAGQGIGAACARALGEAGAKVIVADFMPDRIETAVAELRKLKIDAHGAKLDVTKSKEVDAVCADILKAHGHVDILVNNAGVARSDVRAEDTTDAHWRHHMDVNVDGLFWCCRAFGGAMLKQGKGSIVNIGSMSGFIVNKPQPQSFYNASKAAVHHLTRSLAAEWAARGVRVNA